MDRYLVFDGSCSMCSQLAEVIQGAVGARLNVISIYSNQARQLLDQAYPMGWVHAPYFITTNYGTVRAWTGVQGALRLGLLTGPRKGWQIWKSARRSGVRIRVKNNAVTSHGVPRRTVLKGITALAATFGVTLVHATPAAHAANVCPCYSSNTTCRYFSATCGRDQYCGYLPAYIVSYNCYNNCWEYCWTNYTIQCGC